MSRFPTRSIPILPLAAAAITLTAPAHAADSQPPADVAVDVTLHETPPPRRIVSIEFNPLPLIIGKVSASLVIVPVDHHALTLTPFYISATSQPIYIFNDQGPEAQLPQQTFSGFGGELGYRYYTGLGGPRGFFVGPSLILASMNAKAQNAVTTGYLDWGLAADVGYEMLLADNLAVSLGAGIQYTNATKSIPDQQFPLDYYANSRVAPRALASIGWAF